MTRAFVALDLDEASLDLVLGAAGALRASAPTGPEPRWTSREQMHLTVKFLGSASAPLLDAVADAVRACRAPAPLTARLVGAGGFPSDDAATVLVGMLDDRGGSLSALAQAVDTRAASLGVPADDRLYRPHVTLARFRERCPVGPWIRRTPLGPADLRFVALALYRSDTLPSGVRYTPLLRLPLG